MGYQVLARKYRPQRFADVAGQDHVTVTLMNALVQNRIAHGYIFSGHRGIGKTTIARILACALNCRNPIGSTVRPTAEPCEVCESCTEIRAGNSVDVIEIDAATNRGIDEIRELRDAARYRPSRDRFKIYILDEAHQITDAAFNALLKTLEEPPDHIVFMMATTQPEDIPQTVRSRCQHFSFHAVKLADILGELRGIAEHEGVDADEAALNLLAEAGDGSMRDALSIMDQAIASAPVVQDGNGPGRARLDAGQIRELMGAVPNATFERILEAVDGNRSAEVMSVANNLLDQGNSPAQLARQAVRYLRSCVIAKIAGLTPAGTETTELLQISPEEQRRAARTAALFTEEELTRFLQVLLRTFDELGYRQEQRFHFELGLLKLVHLRRLLPVEQVLSALSAGGPAAGGAKPQSPANLSAPSRLAAQAPTPTLAPAEPARPVFSPFEKDSQQKRRYDSPPAPQAAVPATAPSLRAGGVPDAAVERPPASLPVVNTREREIERQPGELPRRPSETVQRENVSPAAPPEAEQAAQGPGAAPSRTDEAAAPGTQKPSPGHAIADALQHASVDALQKAGQVSASEAAQDATWTLDGEDLRIQTTLSKTMLPVVLNPEAEKMLRAAVRVQGGQGLKVTLLPGASKPANEKRQRAAREGSAEAKALQHPVVVEAQRLFDAEVQTVIDLRDPH